MQCLSRTAQGYAPRIPHSRGSLNETEVPRWRLRSCLITRSTQVCAARAQRPSTDVIATESGANRTSAAAATSSGPTVFSYLGLGSRNSDSVDVGVSGADGGGAAAAAVRGVSHGAGEALVNQLRLARERLGTSLEQLFFDGIAEGLPAWPTGQMAGVLMALAALQRRPDEVWLAEYWSVTLARLGECSTADLAMLSYGVSEMGLQPPPEWTSALLAATLRLAEAPPSPLPHSAAAVDGPPEGPRAAGDGASEPGAADSWATSLQLALQHAARGWDQQREEERGSGLWLGGSPGVTAGAGARVGRRVAHLLPAGLKRLLRERDAAAPAHTEVGSAAGAASAAVAYSSAGDASPPMPASRPASAATSGAAAGGGGGSAASSSTTGHATDGSQQVPPVRAINSAYDMEDIFGYVAPETSSGIAELVLEPVQALWGGVARAGAAVSAAWRRSRGGSELVTVVYNLTAAGLPVEDEWLVRFLQAMRSRLPDLSGDDLHCLLEVPADAAAGGSADGGARLVEAGLSREWQAALFARMDGINWALQGRHLVGCLAAICSMGLRPPPPWVRRQLLSLQPGLQFLPTLSLVQLGGLLPLLPLQWTGEALGSGCSAAGAVPSSSTDGQWLERWLAEYRAAVSERRTTMEAADLLTVIAGVAAVAVQRAAAPEAAAARGPTSPAPAGGAAAANRDLASLLLPRAGEVPYWEWRAAMVDAVATRLPEADLAGLCEAWQVLADASVGAEQQQQQQPQQVSPGGALEGFDADEAATHLSGLRELVAARLAVYRGQMSTSDVASVFSSLAAAGLPLPPATLDALLTSAQPLLPGLTSSELVTVALSLLRLSYKPNIAWQAAFCAASRRRLGLMTPPQRCSLLVASASLGLHLPDPWVREFFAVSERCLGEQLDGTQLANMLWAVSCVASEPSASWLEHWEYASMSRLRELGPNMLAVVLKAMSTLHYRPSAAWQSAFFAALQRRLFAAGAAQLSWTLPDDPSPASSSSSSSHPSSPAASSTAAAESASGSSLTDSSGAASSRSSGSPLPLQSAPPSSPLPPSSSSWSSSSSGQDATGMLSTTVTVEALNSLVYSLATLDLSPPAAWLDELADAIRCKLSLMSTLDLSVVLAFLVARTHRPNDEWWESFLEALESRFDALSASEMSSLLVMLNALRVSPTAQWLDGFCAATQPRLALFQPSHLLQVLSCLHLFRHRPGQAWMAAYTVAVEGQLPRFTPTELARAMMLLDNLNQRPSAAFMLRFFDFSRPGLAQLDTQELVNVAWAVVSCSTLHPDIRWTEALVEAARPRLASLQPAQLRVLVAALGHMQRGGACAAAEDFLAFAREFLVV